MTNQIRQLVYVWHGMHDAGRAGTGGSIEDVADWMYRAARRGLLLDPGLLLLAEDPALIGRLWPEQILLEDERDPEGPLRLNPAVRAIPYSFVIVSHLPGMSAPGGTPIVWTRGLERSGEWRTADGTESGGVFAEGGGWIGFLDGRVEYFRNLHENGGQLRSFRTGARTADIWQALPPGTRVIGQEVELRR
ncbi:MAG: hypothetical protein LR015_09545 [Verrucomicrobia bacterium]|nr:hypothetical protein [Verrucomicrobiota bacterium]